MEKKSIYLIIMVLIICISIFGFLIKKSNDKIVFKYLNNLKSQNYHTDIVSCVMTDKGQQANMLTRYNYKNGIEKYYNTNETYDYRDYTNTKRYVLKNSKFKVIDLKLKSNYDNINELLSKATLTNSDDNIFDFTVNKSYINKFLNNYSGMIKFSNHNNYKIEILISNQNIRELTIYDTNDRYIKFIFSGYNTIDDITLPTV